MAKVESARVKLPLLKEGPRNLETGTYVAEQISRAAYDLVSAGAAQSRTHIGRAGAISPSPEGSSACSPRDFTKRGRKHKRDKLVKCTQLPALENIDTLFKSRDDESDDLEDDSYERRKLEPVAEAPDEIEDREFREWLKLPRLGNSPRESPDVSRWHLLISSKSFRAHSDKYIAASLVQVLGLSSHEDAFSKVEKLHRRRLMILDAFTDKAEAFKKLQKLRSLGLQAQVVLDFGLPAEGKMRERRKRQHAKQSVNAQMRSYTELFFQAGADRSTSKWIQMGPGGQSSRKRAGLAQWRSVQGNDFTQDVVPEDPVEALFSEERRKDRNSGKGLFKSILRKVDSELKNRVKESMRQAGKDVKEDPNAGDALANLVKEAQVFHKEDPSAGDAFANVVKEAQKHTKDAEAAAAAVAAAASTRDLTQGTGPQSEVDHKDREIPMKSRSSDGAKSKDASTAVPVVALAVSQQKEAKSVEATAARREACLLMRFFVFGNFLDEGKDREEIFTESIGTREQVKSLFRIYGKLDDDNSDRIDIGEFKEFAAGHTRQLINAYGMPPEAPKLTPKQKKEREKSKPPLHKQARGTVDAHHKSVVFQLNNPNALMSQAVECTEKFVTTMIDALAKELLGKKSSFSLEDMMKLVWLSATLADVKTMKGWCKEHLSHAVRNRVATPPVLDKTEFEGLCSVFDFFDEDRSDEISFDALVTKGLIYEEQVDEYRRLWDNDGNGILDKDEFCDMMCPIGFRATEKAEIGSRPDGSRVIFDPVLGGWKLDEPFLFPEDKDKDKEEADELLQ